MCMNQTRLFDVIANWKLQGLILDLVKLGVISSRTVNYFEINDRLEQKQKLTRTSKTTIIMEVAEEFRVKFRTVQRAQQEMNRPLSVVNPTIGTCRMSQS